MYHQEKLQQGGNAFLLRFPDGLYFTLRYLTYREYRTFEALYKGSASPNYLIDQLVTMTSIVSPDIGPEWFMDKKAGYCSTIAGLSMFFASDHREDTSGAIVGLINTGREQAGGIIYQMFSLICRAYPGYKFSDLEEVPFPEIARIFACAERALLETGALEEPVRIGFGDEASPQKQPTSVSGPSDIHTGKPTSDNPPGSAVITEEEIASTYKELGIDPSMEWEAREAMREQQEMINDFREKMRPKKKPSRAELQAAMQKYNESIGKQSRKRSKVQGKF